MGRNNKQPNKSAAATEQAPSLPPNAVALSPATVGVTLTVGKKYAIKNPTRHIDDAQNILTEDIFRSSIPEGFFIVQAVGPRHYVPIEYDPSVDVEPGELTGFAPNFTQDEDLSPNPTRQRMLRQFYGNGSEKGNDLLLQQRNKLLAKTNAVAAAASSPSGQGGDIVHTPQGQTGMDGAPGPAGPVIPPSLSTAPTAPTEESEIPEQL